MIVKGPALHSGACPHNSKLSIKTACLISQDFQNSLDLGFVMLRYLGRCSPLLGFAGQDLNGCHQAIFGRIIEICGTLSKSQAHGSNDCVSQFSVVLCLSDSLARSSNGLFLRLVEAFDD